VDPGILGKVPSIHMVGVPLYDMYEFWSIIPQKLAAFKKINQSAEGNPMQYWYD
jgi:hypothetical protein